ncbi:MAG TPA: DEAD/DEAH box helicase [Acidimicrobiales bacterium]|nr:DEAD/DEAH box helicase [Acidimicrobiales bacterium]
MPGSPPLDQFSPAVRAWFETSFPEPTPPQAKGWPTIASGSHTLILAPTGSGKTLSAFLWAIDRLTSTPPPEERTHRTRVIYLSPLRALAVDVEKNLRAPIQGIRLAAERLGLPYHEPTVGIRTGDTPADERRKLVRNPPDILITTPESLYLMLTSQARETLQGVEAVIVDEIHAVAKTKRGSHLSLTLERLAEVTDRPGGPQRIGLSATQRPLEEIAAFLGGRDDEGSWRKVEIVDAGVRKELDVEVIVPVEDMGDLGKVIEEPISGPASLGPVRRSIWPSMHPRLLELVQEHRSTLIFVNARRLAERLATRLNELAHDEEDTGDAQLGVGHVSDDADVPELVKAHHGSISRERRLQIEDELKSGRLKGLVATSSLELGIDMGAVDLVVQVESPGSVSSGLQRIGRAGHQVGEPSRGKLFPKHRSDLVEAAVVVKRMQDGLIEKTRYPRNPLDVLCQQIVAMCALDEWPVERLAQVLRRSASFATLTDDVLYACLDLLAGRYPSEEFSELRPRIVWDRTALGEGAGVVRGRAGAQRLAVTNPGTIPDRGLFGVFLPDGTRVGELDEEMVYESRAGETFLLGASTWRIEDITFDRVIVTPAPGMPGKMPFWHGEGPGRPLELGRGIGQFVRELRDRRITPDPVKTLREDHGLDELAALNLVAYLDEQAEATGAVPDDRTIVVERFRDEIGDWRVCVLSPFGAQVHAPWAMALQHTLGERWGVDVEMLWSDDGIVLRLPEAVDELPVEELAIPPDEIRDIVLGVLPNTAMFASRFREAAGRALLLPRRRPDRRQPLWQQRQRAADLLKVAAKYPTFPILLETTRECVNDVFDLPALEEVLRDIRSRAVRVVPVQTEQSSPMAQSLLFGWIAVYMYEGDAPLAERRAAALALDRDLLRELLGSEELRELIDPEVLADLELELQRLVEGRRARDADEVHDLLRVLGPLTVEELDLRCEGDAAALVEQLAADRRAYVAGIAGEDRWAVTEDAGRLRDALGVAVPMGLPAAYTDPVDDPMADLVARYARTHAPFTTGAVAHRYGVSAERVLPALERLEADGRVLRGEFRPDGHDREWTDPDVLRTLRRRSLAALRKEVEPVEADALGRFLPAWHHVGSERRGIDALVDTVSQLQGAPIPASVLEADVLPVRLRSYEPAQLDELCAAGEVVWVGAGALGAKDGRVRLLFRDHAALLVPTLDPPPDGEVHQAVLEHLRQRGASFWNELVAAAQQAGAPYDEASVLAALWDLVWAGYVTNDGLGPLRAFLGSKARRASGRRGGSRPRPGRLTRLGPPAGAGRWSLVEPLLQPAPSPTEAAHAKARQLLERYGVLTREAALGEGSEGGFAGVYPVLKALEERGEIRRGYFVAGLGAAQFALAGAVDRLRAAREQGTAEGVVLAATDPAQPYGAALPWAESAGRPARQAGAHVVLVDGELVAFLERGGHSVSTFPGTGEHPEWATLLHDLVHRGRYRSLEIRKVDGQPVLESPFVDVLRQAGYRDGYKGLVHRPS